jgi:UDP-N-acetylglucosamine 2-epimerase
VCNTYFFDKKIFIIQQGSMLRAKELKYSLRDKVSYLIHRYGFQIPIFSFNPLQAYKINAIHLLWSDFFYLNPKVLHHSTGNPAWDKLLVNFIVDHSDYSFSDKRNKVCFTTQPLYQVIGEDNYNEFMTLMKSGIKKLDGFGVIVKVHPREDIERYEKEFSKEEYPNVEVIKNVSLEKVFEQCFVIITGWSATSYEAIAKGIPVILINPDNKQDYSYRYPPNSISLATNSDDMISEIKKLTLPNEYNNFLKQRTNFLKKVNTNTDGTSAKAIAQIILQST